MSTIKITLILIPESYDYGAEDIVYRIIANGQLIIERSMPLLEQNQAVADTFYLNGFIEKKILIDFKNIKNKKAKLKFSYINDQKTKHIYTAEYSVAINQLN